MLQLGFSTDTGEDQVPEDMVKERKKLKKSALLHEKL